MSEIERMPAMAAEGETVGKRRAAMAARLGVGA